METFEEIHSTLRDGTDEWKPFRIEKCKVCGRVPNIVKNFEISGKGRYKLGCCGVLIKESTETKTMYEWNLAQSMEV